MKRSFGYALAALVAIVLVIAAAVSLLPPREIGRDAARPPASLPPPLAKLVETEAEAPLDIVFQAADGSDVTLRHFRGRGLVVNLWATWCAPCIEELPALDRLAASLEGSGVEVLPISIDRDGRAVVGPFFERLGIERLRSAYDPSMRLNLALKVRGLPTTVLIDAEGRLAGWVGGIAAWDDPSVRDWLVARLAPR